MRCLRVVGNIVFCVLILSFAGNADNKFVGVKKCMACHKVEKLGGLAYTVWEKSAHAKAYQTLLGDEAKKVAREKGLETAPAESPECLKCHVTGGGAAINIEKGFKKEEGVTCEACHGAASGYMALHSKKDDASKAKAKEAGMVIAKEGKVCETCHNAENPTQKTPFNQDDMWTKIEHKLQAKK